jgi:hypothetical protein
LAGAAVVVLECAPVREYFGTLATYLPDLSLATIRHGIDVAWRAPRTTALQEYIRQNYTWEHAARKTIDAYNFILKRDGRG